MRKRLKLMRLVALTAIALGMFVGVARPDEVEHPMYKSWAQYKAGTKVKARSTTVQRGKIIVTEYDYRLTNVAADKVEIELIVSTDSTGTMISESPIPLNYKRMFPLFPGVRREDIGKPMGAKARGSETIKVGAREYKATWYETEGKTEGGPSLSKTWLSDQMPGMLVKDVSRFPTADKVTTLEIIEVKPPE